MRRTLSVCALLLILPPYGRAADAPAPTETVIRMKVHPTPAPKPALRYQLLPELREMNPGNPIHEYSRCFAQSHEFWHDKQAVENREKWQTMPLKELPLKDMRKSGYGEGGKILRRADYAARLDAPNWQILLQIRSEGVNLLLPDLQELRNLATALKVRCRVEIAERRFDDALVTAKTMLGLSRHLGEHPTVIGGLVGIAIASVTVGPLDELIQQPDCPNLFWALTDLPHPFLDLRKGFQGERVFLKTEFALLDEHAPMTEAQLKKAVDHIRQLMKDANVAKDVTAWLNGLAKDEEHVRAARKRLVESGLAEDKVKTFPAPQVVLLDEKLEYQVRRDEEAKAMALPYWQAETVFRARKRQRAEREDTLFAGLETAYVKVKQVQSRLEQRLGLLGYVEALRLYAAEHDGKLPAKLADVKLPLPVDAVTGKPFVYERKGDTAILRGTPPPGQENVAAYNVRYEVTIAK